MYSECETARSTRRMQPDVMLITVPTTPPLLS